MMKTHAQRTSVGEVGATPLLSQSENEEEESEK